jgi:hypothetical protein
LSQSAADEALLQVTGPEPALARIFDAIERNLLDQALEHAELLLKVYPNFRLANLIKGDLLLARARPLRSLGDGGGASVVAGEKLTDLREEAIVRLKGYRSKPPADFVPRYLLQMLP